MALELQRPEKLRAPALFVSVPPTPRYHCGGCFALLPLSVPGAKIQT